MAHESPGVGDEEGGRKASGVAEKPRGSRQGVGGGVELPQGADTPKVATVPQRDKTPGVTTARASKPREDGRGRGGDEKSPTTRVTGVQGNVVRDDKPMGGTRTAALPGPHRGTAADDGSAETPPRNTAGTNSARPKHGTLARRKYGLLAPEGTAVDPADAGDLSSEAGYGAT